MTTTLLLLTGAGIGALLATILLLFVMARTSACMKATTSTTEQLMRERNDLDREKVDALKKIVTWTETNWKL